MKMKKSQEFPSLEDLEQNLIECSEKLASIRHRLDIAMSALGGLHESLVSELMTLRFGCLSLKKLLENEGLSPSKELSAANRSFKGSRNFVRVFLECPTCGWLSPLETPRCGHLRERLESRNGEAVKYLNLDLIAWGDAQILLAFPPSIRPPSADSGKPDGTPSGTFEEPNVG